MCPVFSESFYLSSCLRYQKFRFDFLLQFGFENTESITFLVVIYHSVSVLPYMSQTCISQESSYWVIPEVIMIWKVAENVFDIDVVVLITWKSLSNDCVDIVLDLFRTGT